MLRLVHVTFSCADPGRVAEFWAALLDYERAPAGDSWTAKDPRGEGTTLLFNRMQVADDRGADPPRRQRPRARGRARAGSPARRQSGRDEIVQDRRARRHLLRDARPRWQRLLS